MRYGRVILVCGLTFAALGASNVTSYSREQTQPVRYAVTQDRCLGLLDVSLKTAEAAAPVIHTNTIARQTALGLMLGVRSVSGPRIAHHEKQKLAGIDSDRAKAVARYRHCRSQQTLESFASN